MAIQNGSTYISDSTTDITTIPTAKLGFSTTVSTSVYNLERQPEIAIWPPKPEVVILPELQQIASRILVGIRRYFNTMFFYVVCLYDLHG